MTILAKIERQDMDDYMLLVQNVESYDLVELIKKENGTLTSDVKNRIDVERAKGRRKTLDWWEQMALKYKIPFYPEGKMFVDMLKACICVDD